MIGDSGEIWSPFAFCTLTVSKDIVTLIVHGECSPMKRGFKCMSS